MASYSFFNRDLSWLSFNARLLQEADNPAVPLGERIKFLSIYSANLDEFYRVRIPAIKALQTMKAGDKLQETDLPAQVQAVVQQQLVSFGRIIGRGILPALKKEHIHLLYGKRLTGALKQAATEYFYTEVAAFLQVVEVARLPTGFFPGNNTLYLAVAIAFEEGPSSLYLVNIPSDVLSRFHVVSQATGRSILFLDDVIKSNLDKLFPGATIEACSSFKITRDAELELDDEYEGNLARKIEKKIAKRDFGLATRVLYQPGLSADHLDMLCATLGLQRATLIEGGVYHNLRDLADLPIPSSLYYEPWPVQTYTVASRAGSLFQDIDQGDLLHHVPYQSYATVLRFFNEAAITPSVTRIYVTLYRVARDSRIAHALISAARNGKKVTVFVELKARFDEANNLRWARLMKAAGVKIIESIPGLKVHAKIALVKRKTADGPRYAGLLATGNFNESTARFYTDHVLFTARQDMLLEMEGLFRFLKQRIKPPVPAPAVFQHLLVARFNLQERFLEMIQREVNHARQGLPAGITIKLNNLEDKVLIKALYQASQAGVEVRLIVRSVCCLVPGVPAQSEHIAIKRIVDRYLEHGRIFIFTNAGQPDVYLGSADWMNRNIYRRIEVCFPIYDQALKEEVVHLVTLQWHDTEQGVWIDQALNNLPAEPTGQSKKRKRIRSQKAIGLWLKSAQSREAGT